MQTWHANTSLLLSLIYKNMLQIYWMSYKAQIRPKPTQGCRADDDDDDDDDDKAHLWAKLKVYILLHCLLKTL